MFKAEITRPKENVQKQTNEVRFSKLDLMAGVKEITLISRKRQNHIHLLYIEQITNKIP